MTINIDIPEDYAALRKAYDDAWKLLSIFETKEEHDVRLAAFLAAHEWLSANPHNQWLQDLRKDEEAAREMMLPRVPRRVTMISVDPDPIDLDDPKIYTEPVPGDLDPNNLESALNVFVDTRRVNAKQAAKLLRAAADDIDKQGMLVAYGPMQERPEFIRWINERPDGRLVSLVSRNDGSAR